MLRGFGAASRAWIRWRSTAAGENNLYLALASYVAGPSLLQTQTLLLAYVHT